MTSSVQIFQHIIVNTLLPPDFSSSSYSLPSSSSPALPSPLTGASSSRISSSGRKLAAT